MLIVIINSVWCINELGCIILQSKVLFFRNKNEVNFHERNSRNEKMKIDKKKKDNKNV